MMNNTRIVVGGYQGDINHPPTASGDLPTDFSEWFSVQLLINVDMPLRGDQLDIGPDKYPAGVKTYPGKPDGCESRPSTCLDPPSCFVVVSMPNTPLHLGVSVQQLRFRQFNNCDLAWRLAEYAIAHRTTR